MRIENLSAGYGSIGVIEIPSLSLNEAVLTGLAGANGSGKSTLLKAISGHVGFTGSVEWGGRELVPRNPWNRFGDHIGYMPQENGAFGELSVGDNLLFVADRIRKERDALEREFQLWLPGIKKQWNQAAKSLSGGEYQRLAIAMVLARDSQSLLLDEPSANLDEPALRMLEEHLREVVKVGKSVLVAEQNLDFLCDVVGMDGTILCLTDGRICHSRRARERHLIDACVAGRCGS